MVDLPEGEKVQEYVYSFWYNTQMWWTDRQTLHDGTGHTVHSIMWQKLYSKVTSPVMLMCSYGTMYIPVVITDQNKI